MPNTIVDYYLIGIIDSKIPMITIVDRHNEDICLFQVFLLQKSLYLGLGLRKYVGCEIGVE